MDKGITHPIGADSTATKRLRQLGEEGAGDALVEIGEGRHSVQDSGSVGECKDRRQRLAGRLRPRPWGK